jgi:hypothetical protein
MTDQQLIHKANGVKRIKSALMFPDGEIGTFYSNPFRLKYEISGERFLEIINRHKSLSSFDKLLMFIQGIPIPRVP